MTSLLGNTRRGRPRSCAVKVLGAALMVGCTIAPTARAEDEEPVEARVIAELPYEDVQAIQTMGYGMFSEHQVSDLLYSPLAVYDIYRFDFFLRPGSAERGVWTGTMLMPDVGNDIVRATVDEGFLGYFYSHEGSLSQLLANPAGTVLGVATIGPDGAVASTLDLDGDGVVEFADVLRPDGIHLMMVRRGLGREFLDAWQNGFNPLCLDAADAALRDLTAFADERTMLAGCPSRDAASEETSSSGAFAGAPSRHPLDPLGQLCQEYDERMSPDLIGGTYVDDTADATVAAVAAAAWSSFTSWIAQVPPFHPAYGTPAAAEIAATRAVQYNAVGIFVGILLTPAHTRASPCETAGPGACAREAAAAREEIEEAEAGSESGGGESGSGDEGGEEDPPPPPPDDGTEEDPGEPTFDEGMALFCEATANGRAEWQRSLDEARENGFAGECHDIAAAGEHEDSLYCSTMSRLRNIERYDMFDSIAPADSCEDLEYDRGVCDDPILRMQQELAEMFRATGDIPGFVCNPYVCDPSFIVGFEASEMEGAY